MTPRKPRVEFWPGPPRSRAGTELEHGQMWTHRFNRIIVMMMMIVMIIIMNIMVNDRQWIMMMMIIIIIIMNIMIYDHQWNKSDSHCWEPGKRQRITLMLMMLMLMLMLLLMLMLMMDVEENKKIDKYHDLKGELPAVRARCTSHRARKKRWTVLRCRL